jgi:hypothetical protein
MEESINPATRFILSGELDHKKEEYKVGVGVMLQF